MRKVVPLLTIATTLASARTEESGAPRSPLSAIPGAVEQTFSGAVANESSEPQLSHPSTTMPHEPPKLLKDPPAYKTHSHHIHQEAMGDEKEPSQWGDNDNKEGDESWKSKIQHAASKLSSPEDWTVPVPEVLKRFTSFSLTKVAEAAAAPAAASPPAPQIAVTHSSKQLDLESLSIPSATATAIAAESADDHHSSTQDSYGSSSNQVDAEDDYSMHRVAQDPHQSLPASEATVNLFSQSATHPTDASHDANDIYNEDNGEDMFESSQHSSSHSNNPLEKIKSWFHRELAEHDEEDEGVRRQLQFRVLEPVLGGGNKQQCDEGEIPAETTRGRRKGVVCLKPVGRQAAGGADPNMRRRGQDGEG